MGLRYFPKNILKSEFVAQIEHLWNAFLESSKYVVIYNVSQLA